MHKSFIKNVYMKSVKKKVAIIGCGYWGTNIIKTLLSLKNLHIFCYDNNKTNLIKIKKRFKSVTIVYNLKTILNDKDLKLSFICVTTSQIFSIAKKCIIHKKNVFLEKPVSKDFKKIKELFNLSRIKKVRLMVGYVYIYNSYINYIKKKIDSNFLGKIKYAEFNRKNYGPIREDVSSLWDLTSHDMSIVKYFFKNKITQTKYLRNSITEKKIFDNYSINFNVKKTNININVSWLYPEKIRQILIIGTKKILMFDEMDTDRPIKIFDILKKYPKASDIPLFYFNPQKNIMIMKPFTPKFKKISPLRDELKYCLKNIFTSKKIITDGQFAVDIAKSLKRFE